MSRPPALGQKPVRLALIGCGAWGRKILATILSLTDVHLVCVASRNPETSLLVPPGTRIESDWRRCVAAEDIDAVVVATPAPITPQVCAAALTRGMAVFAEKPVAMDGAQAQSLLDHATKNKAVFHVNHIDLSNAAWTKFLCKSSVISPPWQIDASLGRRWPGRSDCPMLWEWGPHLVACLFSLTVTAPALIDAEALSPEPPAESGDAGGGGIIRLRFAFEQGQATLTFGNGMARAARWVRLSGDGQSLLYDDGAQEKLVHTLSGHPDMPIHCEATPPLMRALARFSEAVRAGKPDTAGLEIAVGVTHVLEKAQALLSQPTA